MKKEWNTVLLKNPEGNLRIATITKVTPMGGINYHMSPGAQGHHPTGTNIIKEVSKECFDIAYEKFVNGGWTAYNEYVKTLI